MRLLLVIFATLLGAAQIASGRTSCQVHLEQTTSWKGVLKQTFDNSSYCAFLGVRYAEPPLGNLRFRHSVLMKPKGHQNLTTRGSMCPQLHLKLDGDEDCLFMNIYTPMVEESTREDRPPYPVLVFVHGGSYVLGHDERDIDGVDLLMDNEILVVTFNYRLYTLGFLKSDENNIAGNFGLKDQTILLRWVQQYIRYFGGDPNQVTFAGQSAGAGSVTLHLYIEQSRNLFHRMIALSGSMLAPWSFLYGGRQCIQNYLRDLPPNTLEQLRSTDFRGFLQGESWVKHTIFFGSMVVSCFIPSAEEEHQDNFTLRSPHESILQTPINPVPILISDTALEFEGLRGESDKFDLEENCPNILNDTVRSLINSTMYNFASKIVAEGEADSLAEVFQTLSNTIDLHYPTLRLVKDLSKTLDPSIPVYFQRFEFDGKFGKSRNVYYPQYLQYIIYGAMHGDDLGYIFSPYNLEEALERPQDYEKEWEVHRGTVELIANFIKYGNPTPTPSKLSNITWPPVNGKKTPNMLLNIDESFEVRPITEDIYSQQWEKVYDCLYYERCDGIEV
uniref:Carboxylesterase type B domain-containing protein n=1 Tax=Anopheles atroparvus TaxID=41427 RepID=A0AAG5DII5_ANOAO